MMKGKGMMKGIDKIKLLKEILEDKDLVSKKILKEEEPEGELIVSAEGESPEDAKKKILAELQGIDLPDEEDMDGMEDEMCEDDMECSDMMDMEDEEDEEEPEGFEMSEEDEEIMDMIPASQRKAFKKRLIEKIKSL